MSHYVYDSRSEDINEPLLVPGKITGYRIWTPSVTVEYHKLMDWKGIPWGADSYLFSLNQRVKWKVEKVEAKCQLTRPKKRYFENSVFKEHFEAPHRPCHCGLYAKYTMNELISSMYSHDRRLYIVGAIEGWGKTILARTGFRCQYAKITSLLVNDRYSMSYMKHVSSHYNVPIFDHESDLASAFPPSDLSALGINHKPFTYGLVPPW